jgi:hypothetical protein
MQVAHFLRCYANVAAPAFLFFGWASDQDAVNQ